MNKHSKKILLGLGVFAGVMIAMSGLYGWLYYQGKDLLAKVGETKITTSELTDRIQLRYGKSLSAATDEEKRQGLKDLIEFEIIKQEAAKSNLTASSSEIDKALEGFTYPASDKSLYVADAENYVLKQKVQDKVVGWKSGDYLVIHFDQNFAGPDNVSSDQALVSADKAYADTLKAKIESGLADGSLTFEAAKKLVGEDAKIGSSILSTAFVAGTFDKNEFYNREEVLQLDQIFNVVKNTAKGKSSQLATYYLTDDKQTPAAYFMVNITDQSGTGENYETWLSNKLTAYKTKVYASYGQDLVAVNARGIAYAATTYTGDDSELGVRTGLSTDWAGLIIKSYIIVSPTAKNLVAAPGTVLRDVDSTESDDGGIVKLSISDVGSACSGTSGTRYPDSKTFTTGYFYKGDTADCTPETQYVKPGYVVLGKGYKSSGVANYGNRYVLDCDDDGKSGNPKHNFDIVPPTELTVDGKRYATAYTSSNFTVTNGSTKTITIDYSIKQWTLTINTLNGTLGSVTGAGIYNDKDTAHVIATSTDPAVKVTWAGDCASFGAMGSDNPLVMDNNKSCTATLFKLSANTYYIQPSANGCSISPSTLQDNLTAGSSKTFTATANPGYNAPIFTIRNIITNATSTTSTNPYTFTNINANYSITANCSQPKTLSCSVSPETGLTPLVVKVTTAYTNLGASPTFDYLMGDGSDWANGKKPVFYYMYSSPGEYEVKVRNSVFGPDPVICGDPVVVTDSNNQSGGEVAP